MPLPFTHTPGRRERHLRRRHLNPLFAWPPREVAPEDLLAAQKADHDDLEAFQARFQDLIQRAAELPPNAGSDEVLGLKEALEAHYEQTYALPRQMADARAALERLIELTMQAVLRQAGTDPLARQELSDEATARGIHFRLLEQPLVADLLHPAGVIEPHDLIPALLSATEAEVEAAVELFDEAQLALLVTDGEALLAERRRHGAAVGDAARRLDVLRLRLAQYGGSDA
jgi:hypothetical protein